MAVFTMLDCYVELNSVNRSGFIKSVTLTVEGDEQDAATFTAAGWSVPISGKRSGSLALTFVQDVAASQIDSVMWPLMFTTVPFQVRATSAAVGASNPRYSGNVLVREWTPLDGSVGDLAEVSVTFPLSGAVTRAVS